MKDRLLAKGIVLAVSTLLPSHLPVAELLETLGTWGLGRHGGALPVILVFGETEAGNHKFEDSIGSR